jgi:tight adherence protein C
MDPLLFVTIMVTVFCGLGLAYAGVMSMLVRTSSRRVQMVVGAPAAAPVAPRRKEFSLAKHALAATHWLSGRMGMANDPALRERMDRAGMTTSRDRDLYFAARLLGPLLGLIAGSFSPFNPAFSMLILVAAAYLLPDILLGRAIASRREKIRLGLPDAVDLLVICVDAGLGMDQAILRVAQELRKSHPVLQEEFLRLNREQRAGMVRLDAWEAMAKRNEVPELDAFVNMLTQTERFGTPIARALSNFGDNIRQKRRQRAEELAAKTTVKIIFPLVLCIFPCIFIVLIGPAGIKISHGFSMAQ